LSGFQLGTGGIVTGSHFFKRHVQLEYFFQKFRRNVLRALLADLETFLAQHVLGALYRSFKARYASFSVEEASSEYWRSACDLRISDRDEAGAELVEALLKLGGFEH